MERGGGGEGIFPHVIVLLVVAAKGDQFLLL